MDDEFHYLEAKNLPSHDNFLAEPENSHPSINSTDKLLGMRLKNSHKGEMLGGCATGRERNSDGLLVETENTNPILDTREYNINSGESDCAEYTANIIIENLHDQVDGSGIFYTLLKGIVNF